MEPFRPTEPIPGPTPCFRCGGTERVIGGEGRPICLLCVLGWGSYAALVVGESAPEPQAATVAAGRDPTVTALLHWSHRAPVADCPLCAGRG